MLDCWSVYPARLDLIGAPRTDLTPGVPQRIGYIRRITNRNLLRSRDPRPIVLMGAHRQHSKIKWVSIVGARPQFVKLAPLCRAIEQHNQQCPARQIDHQIIQTGQHYDWDVAGLFFYQMKIAAPKYHLGVGSGSHGTQLARMLARMEPILCAQNPNWVIVYGDTNSTLAGALLAARLNLPLVHIEAGCRSGNLRQVDEQNRIVTDHLSQLLLVASSKCAETLHREGIGLQDDPCKRRVVMVGDILLDALLQHAEVSDEDADIRLREFGLKSKQYCLLTLHRAENTDDVKRLHGILDGVSGLNIPVLFPVHPRTKRILAEEGTNLNGNIRTVEPQGYFEMLTLEKHARKILTDSGGVQKEAFYLGVPCVTLRESTEWLETVEAGANRLVAPNPEEIKAAVCDDHEADWKGFAPYGDGTAAQKIVAELLGSAGQCDSVVKACEHASI
jgi:UDP-GlcNAc3NAcA epimerase